jgi:hypothetical protein
MTIFLDFDGTVVEHAYPAMGRFNPNALAVIKKLQQKGHTIILNTYRSNINDGTLEKALEYLNFHPTVRLQSITPTKEKLAPPPFRNKTGTVAIYTTDKGEAYFFIDDMQPDIPLVAAHSTNTDMVDWFTVEQLLMEAGIL